MDNKDGIVVNLDGEVRPEKMRMRNRGLAYVTAGLIAMCAAGLAHADWPISPITLVMGFPEGSPLDKAAQLLRPALERKLRTPIAFDYRIGADGSHAMSYVAKSRPDGYVILLAPAPARDGTMQTVAPMLGDTSSTLVGAGAPAAEPALWFGLFAPRGVDPQIAEKFKSAARDVLEAPAVREQLASLGFMPRNEPFEPTRAAVVQGASELTEAAHALAAANPSPNLTAAQPLATSRASFKRHSVKGASAPSSALHRPSYSPN